MAKFTIRCERCAARRATVHWTYGHGAEQYERHFCERCSRFETPGWQVVAESRPSLFSPLGFLAAAALALLTFVRLRG